MLIIYKCCYGILDYNCYHHITAASLEKIQGRIGHVIILLLMLCTINQSTCCTCVGQVTYMSFSCCWFEQLP